MNDRWQIYRQAAGPLPDHNLSWPFRGAGLENLGVNGQPVIEPLPNCGPQEILVRVDALGLCASDAKMIRLGNRYPLFFDRDFTKEPARLGHEAAFTVVQVGQAWQGQYFPGQRLGIQPDVHVGGKRAILGVNIPGGMTQYLTLDHQVLAGDEGSYVFPVPPELGYVETAILEPWACVQVAYTPVRRLEPKPGGVMWIRGEPGQAQEYTMSRTLESCRVILTGVPAALAAWVRDQPVESVEYDVGEGSRLVKQFTAGRGFDDIILLDPGRAQVVAEAIGCMAPGGTLNLVTAEPLDQAVPVDVRRLHYEHLAFLGCTGPDIAQAYGPSRNRSELRAGAVTWIVGAGGPMGRMHTQRALEMADGPRAVIVTNRGQDRLASLVRDFGPLAQSRGLELVAVSPEAEPGRLEQEIARLTGGRGCDDIVVIVPDIAVVGDALPHLAEDGMLVIFSGVPAENRVALPLDRISLHGAQITGSSGSTVADELKVLADIRLGKLFPARPLAAIGGLKTIARGLQAVMDRTYSGKIVIFPQLLDLPLLSLPELKTALPEVYQWLGPGELWTTQAEQALFEHYLP